jgi:hypothetical protein
MEPHRHLALPLGSDPRERRPHLRVVGAGTPAIVAGPRCGCGHGRQAHEHYRAGSDCATCDCGRFARPFLARVASR